jgi:hypothetical protein
VGGGDDQDGQVRADHLNGLDELEPVPVGHVDVTENDVVGIGRGPLKALMTVVGGVDGEPLLLQAAAQQVLGGFGVFENKNAHGSLQGGFPGCLRSLSVA